MTRKLLSSKIGICVLLLLVSWRASGQYCEPSYSSGCASGSTIQTFKTSGAYYNIDNSGSGCGATYDYTDMFVTAAPGTTINVNGRVTRYRGGIKIWVDWNQDENFTDSTELVYASASIIPSGSTFTGSFVVPATALLGATRMRSDPYAGKRC